MTTAFLSLGSNVGDRLTNIRSAIHRLGFLGKDITTSSTYETEPVELADQPWFLNCVARLETEKNPQQLLAEVLTIENEMGRIRNQEKGPRTIDIDILLYGNSIVQVRGLTIPHPAMHLRKFVLEPLAEIAADVRHPVLGQSMRELRDGLGAGQTVKRL